MPIVATTHALPQGTAVKVVANDNMPQEVHIHNHEHATSKSIYIDGNSSVGTASYHLDADTYHKMTLRPGDEVWAFTVESGGADLRTFVIRKSD